MSSAAADFAAALAVHGLTPPEIVTDGKLRRFDGPDDKRGKRNAWYVLYGDGVAAGAFGNWKTGLHETWCAKADREMTQAERAASRERMREAKAAREAEEARDAEAARTTVSHHWEVAGGVRADHPYVVQKGVHPYGAKQLRDALVIPLRDSSGMLHSAQYIQPDGEKRFKSGGRVAGCFCLVGDASGNDGTILIAEGWATACSLHEATGWPVLAAMHAGNLTTVANAARTRWPRARLIVCADDDYQTAGNPGLTQAHEAAHAAGGTVAVPDFGANRPDGATDFNDLYATCGADAVRACVDDAIERGQQVEPSPTDAAPDGEFPGINERPCWRVYEGWQKVDGKRVKPGVYWHGVTPGKGDAPPALVDRWVSSPLWVRAVTRNREDAEYGRLLEILSPAGRRKKWAMPMSMLAGDGNEARGVLLGEGLVFDLTDKGAILRYIAGQFPQKAMRAASVTGWHDEAFVLPDSVIGAGDIWFQASGRVAPYASAGTFEGWRELAALACGNPLMMFAMSAAFAGPLLGPLNIDGGGAHLHGDSSCGKTTALLASISVWGGPAFKRTWRATANGLEGAGALHSDTLLALDELGEIDPKSLYEAAYALVNGMGKTRANRYGEARQATRWRVFLLSTGELTIAARMGAGGIEAKAGQELRILDIPVTGAYGIFDDLHGRTSGGVLSDEVRNLAAKHYGHAGPRFVEALVRDLRDGLKLADLLQTILGKRFGALEGQERRAARAFAVCALAGELAASWGIVPWARGDATNAAVHAFKLWRERRATNGQNAEHVSILRAVADFIDSNGDARFSSIEGSADLIRDRAGYYRIDGGRRLYLFTSGGLREATKGYDLARVTAALERAGALADTDCGKRSKTTRTPDGRTPRLYHIDPEKLTEGEP
ncbi:DUF927 domain-containing protein [Paraburkholderia dokdonensis]|uniref:DUF927 domain-containing protein n=1 Tax=Paraburkholderia dokdonensis TaxID=2211211 RepID=UPI001D13164B|nr:DUF927 domain-containing protein [Paraburkholderia dokdonensis]